MIQAEHARREDLVQNYEQISGLEAKIWNYLGSVLRKWMPKHKYTDEV